MVCTRLIIEDRRIKKPYLGGWRHKITRSEYLNAESQTGPRKMPSKTKCSKMTQYIAVTDVETQTPCHHPTQMWRPDCFISSELDKYMTSKPYETYEEMMQRLNHDGNARIIQRNWRIYLLLKNIKEYARQYRELVENCRLYEEEKVMMYKTRHRQEILRRTNPKTRLDFDMLYDLVEQWRQDRIDCVNQRFFKAARCAEGYLILEKTVNMMNVIDTKRISMRARYRNRKRVKFLTVNCKPVRWIGYKEKQTEMITMRNQKARELKMIYDSLTNYEVTRGERMEILTILRKSLELHNCVPAFHLFRLVEQELDYLARELSKDIPMDYFRERIVFGYLHFVRSSHSCCCVNDDREFCKNVDDEKLREPIETRTRMCKSCSKLLPYQNFTVHGRMTRLSTCIACTWLRERNIAHVNYNPYVFLLNCVRTDERTKESPSAIAFMMQKHDMYHLVNNIWHGRSVISENGDLFLLKVVRYDVDKEWSPWNCIVLTSEEAEIHCTIRDLATIYSKPLIEKILLSHQLAKNQFKHLMNFESQFRETFHKIEDKPSYKSTIKVDDYNFF
ncbi:PREDICTED: IQ and ubiquitin-like domain-containing protein [Dufourea novaeangliae]|uniref:IQ and ubiquitin-like domain-containing protein n=1 Tax=Dufourea novaeangliae TaxID=178035 RepID=A0A154PI69_DUFNO|nr:PREDICTED: IQ and ubiquitin-like domain-containing protein [Dufourea novaeangliae]KZC10890.1 IQ and ubiquitin-like domain-containing protein [Dufourea novaeangliae]